MCVYVLAVVSWVNKKRGGGKERREAGSEASGAHTSMHTTRATFILAPSALPPLPFRVPSSPPPLPRRSYVCDVGSGSEGIHGAMTNWVALRGGTASLAAAEKDAFALQEGRRRPTHE